MKDKNWQAAISDLTTAIEHIEKPSYPGEHSKFRKDVLFERARAYTSLKDYRNAISDLNSGIDLDKYNNPPLYLLRARILKSLGNSDLAKKDYAKAYEGYKSSKPDVAKQIQAEADLPVPNNGSCDCDPQCCDPTGLACPG